MGGVIKYDSVTYSDISSYDGVVDRRKLFRWTEQCLKKCILSSNPSGRALDVDPVGVSICIFSKFLVYTLSSDPMGESLLGQSKKWFW